MNFKLRISHVLSHISLSKSTLSEGQFWLKTIGVAIAYYLVAEFSLSFATLEAFSTPLWLSAGIAVGALLIWGYELWLGVFIGQFIVELLIFEEYGTFSAWMLTISVTIVAVLGKLLAAYLIKTSTQGIDFLNKVENVLKFISLGSFISHLPVGLLCVFFICLFSEVSWAEYPGFALTWWLSDGCGIFIITPLIVAWYLHFQDFRSNLRKRGFEMGAIAFLVLAISSIAFVNGYPVEYMLIPLLLWAVFRLSSPSVTLLIVTVSLISLVGTAQGQGSFYRENSLNESLVLLESFIVVVGLTILISYAVVQENNRSKAALSLANITLEDRVAERTSELATANQKIIGLNKRLKAENLRLGAELQVARQIQQMILPRLEELQEITDLDISGYMKPADEVGGDYYDVLYMDGIVTIGIGDVTGHGLESGILMLMTQTAVRTLQESRQANPVSFLDTLNRTLYKNIQRMDIHRDLSLAILNYANGRISISGQHEEVLVIRNNGSIERIDTIDLGFPIGLSDQITDFIGQISVDLTPGDGIVVYTDGITEAENLQNKHYGIHRLCDTISRHWNLSAKEIENAVIEDLETFIKNQKVLDDVTLVILKRSI